MTTKRMTIDDLNLEGAKRLACAILSGLDDELDEAVQSRKPGKILAGYKILASDWYEGLSMGNSVNRLEIYHERVLAERRAVSY